MTDHCGLGEHQSFDCNNHSTTATTPHPVVATQSRFPWVEPRGEQQPSAIARLPVSAQIRSFTDWAKGALCRRSNPSNSLLASDLFRSTVFEGKFYSLFVRAQRATMGPKVVALT